VKRKQNEKEGEGARIVKFFKNCLSISSTGDPYEVCEFTQRWVRSPTRQTCLIQHEFDLKVETLNVFDMCS